ncbi:MAG: hypothetical protein M3O35_19360 [Acidobacteriota bacterium]|nr:hypothetical protein [Acidobacteriota bacterium]
MQPTTALLLASLLLQPASPQPQKSDSTAPPTRQQPKPPQEAPVYTTGQSGHGHDGETNPGKRPDPPRQGDNTGWIAGAAAGAVGAIALGTWLHSRSQPDHQLARNGPQAPDQFSMSGFEIHAFCMAGWPVVVEYYLEPGGVLQLTIEAEGVQPIGYRLRATGRREQAIVHIPAYFPRKPVVGRYTIRAIRDGLGPVTPVYSRLFGLGGGERAVGSVAIDQVSFTPEHIRPKQKESARFAFHTHTDFDKVSAEFLKCVTAQSQMVAKLEDRTDMHRIVRDTTPSRDWNGKKATPGDHTLQVRAWESALDKANWVMAWSADKVIVEE